MSKASKRLDNPARDPLPGQTSFLGEVQSVQLTVPIAEFPKSAYVTQHVEVQLDGEQAVALKRVFTALDLVGARLANGRRVQSHADAVKHVLEAIAYTHGQDAHATRPASVEVSARRAA